MDSLILPRKGKTTGFYVFFPEVVWGNVVTL